ncbi:MAG: hypothetical protein ACI8TX_002459 [Hyphomicrobiaceae bacterium]|jgi:hypothetical protein
MGIFHDLGIAVRRFRDVQRDKSRDTTVEEDVRLAEQGTRLLQKLPEDFPGKAVLVDLSADVAPWFKTPLEVEAGQEVTWLAAGRVWLSKPLDVYVPPAYQLWARVAGQGPLANGARSTHTFRAENTGSLELASYFPGEWKDADGNLANDANVYQGTRGNLVVLAIAWDIDAASGLEKLRELGDPCRMVSAELERLATAVAAPQGWEPHRIIGNSEIYTPTHHNDRPAIKCRTYGDVGIVCHDVDVALSAQTELRWNWRVDRLPSALPEDSAISHDYLSIAVEFENGKDITYYWSSGLPVEHAYWCPLQAWKDREFHVVVRSGPIGLGAWQSESRNVAADYERWMGDKPGRIVRVWLIANSMMQRKLGEALYSDIVLENEDGPRQVL